PQCSGGKRGIILYCMNDPQPDGHMASYLGRRKFLATLGGAAAAWPLAARAQQAATPVIGFLYFGWPDTNLVATFHKGLNETGYFEGRTLGIGDAGDRVARRELAWGEPAHGKDIH